MTKPTPPLFLTSENEPLALGSIRAIERSACGRSKMATNDKKLVRSKSGLKIVSLNEETSSPFILQEPRWVPDNQVTWLSSLCNVNICLTSLIFVTSAQTKTRDPPHLFTSLFVNKNSADWSVSHCLQITNVSFFCHIGILSRGFTR